jgi:hypothetical protein
MNCKARKILVRSPDDLRQIMALLPPSWKVVAVNDSGRHHWNASIQSPKKKYNLSSDRMYVDISEVTSGKEVKVMPPEGPQCKISFAQVAALLMSLDSSRAQA